MAGPPRRNIEQLVARIDSLAAEGRAAEARNDRAEVDRIYQLYEELQAERNALERAGRGTKRARTEEPELPAPPTPLSPPRATEVMTDVGSPTSFTVSTPGPVTPSVTTYLGARKKKKRVISYLPGGYVITRRSKKHPFGIYKGRPGLSGRSGTPAQQAHRERFKAVAAAAWALHGRKGKGAGRPTQAQWKLAAKQVLGARR